MIDRQINDVTPKVLMCTLRRRMTEVNQYVFDRGKHMIDARYLGEPPPSVNVCFYEEHEDIENIPCETDTWNRNDKGLYEPSLDDDPVVNKLHSNIQSDSGANRIVTDDITILDNLQHIQNYPMGGCNKDDVAIVCTAKGMLTLTDTDGRTLRVLAYYSKEVDGTIVSPTAIIRQHSSVFSSFIQYSNCDNNTGNIKLIGREGYEDFKMNLQCKNDLWYHTLPAQTSTIKERINKISAAALHELWHQRTGHSGNSILRDLHKHAVGVPKLKGNAFYRCNSCMSGKLCTKRPYKGKPKTTTTETPIHEDTLKGQPGQHYHIDFGFVRGTEASYNTTIEKEKSQRGKIVTSLDGSTCYVIIVDRITQYTWIFLAKNKKPPVQTIKQILDKFKSEDPNRTVRTDQGGELGHSTEFATMVAQCGYSLEETGSDASSQNGIAERPN